ncbi:hypothetical protein BJX68DRAFT_248223 [Aspergillus pseudodeflectus]|uniref:Uncharacterized protein n=1 Tax=Aspergillus pseudodeflectus TaxID=176178 RepID=A0ABR4JGK7_9EURO
MTESTVYSSTLVVGRSEKRNSLKDRINKHTVSIVVLAFLPCNPRLSCPDVYLSPPDLKMPTSWPLCFKGSIKIQSAVLCYDGLTAQYLLSISCSRGVPRKIPARGPFLVLVLCLCTAAYPAYHRFKGDITKGLMV